MKISDMSIRRPVLAIVISVIITLLGVFAIKLLPISHGAVAFFDFPDYERLVEAARGLDERLAHPAPGGRGPPGSASSRRWRYATDGCARGGRRRGWR